MKNAIQISLILLIVIPLVTTSCRRKPANDYYEVPLTFTEAGLPVITVTFTDALVPFVIDSGSNRCLIDSAIADMLQLPPICPRSSSEVAIQGKTVELVHVHDVSFTIKNQVFIVQTLMIAELSGGPSDGIHGILGMDFLKSAHAVIDIAGERLLIRKPNSLREHSNDNRAIYRSGGGNREQ